VLVKGRVAVLQEETANGLSLADDLGARGERRGRYAMGRGVTARASHCAPPRAGVGLTEAASTGAPRHPFSSAPFVELDTDRRYLTITPLSITPEQYADLLHSFARSPETGLMVAVIADALWVSVRHIRRPVAKRQREVDEAKRWFASESAAGIFTFVNVCTALDLEPKAVRSALAAIETAERDAASVARCHTFRRSCGRHQSVAGLAGAPRRTRDRQTVPTPVDDHPPVNGSQAPTRRPSVAD